jgi:hypothetical protein
MTQSDLCPHFYVAASQLVTVAKVEAAINMSWPSKDHPMGARIFITFNNISIMGELVEPKQKPPKVHEKGIGPSEIGRNRSLRPNGWPNGQPPLPRAVLNLGSCGRSMARVNDDHPRGRGTVTSHMTGLHDGAEVIAFLIPGATPPAGTLPVGRLDLRSV